MQRPGNCFEALLPHGLHAFDADAEIPVLIAAQGLLNKDEKMPGIAALLEERFLGVATIGLVSHILRARDVGPSSPEAAG